MRLLCKLSEMDVFFQQGLLPLHHFSKGAPSEVEIFALAESSAATCAAGKSLESCRKPTLFLSRQLCMDVSVLSHNLCGVC